MYSMSFRLSFPPPYVQQVDSSISWLYDELDVQVNVEAMYHKVSYSLMNYIHSGATGFLAAFHIQYEEVLFILSWYDQVFV